MTDAQLHQVIKVNRELWDIEQAAADEARWNNDEALALRHEEAAAPYSLAGDIARHLLASRVRPNNCPN